MRILSWDVGLRTLSYCLLSGTWDESGAMTFTVDHWDSIDVQTDDAQVQAQGGQGTGATSKAKRAKVAAVSVEDGARMVMDTLHRRASLFNGVDHVIIEQQPAGGHNRHSNVRMKVVSHVLQCYFYTKGLVTPVAPPAISFVSPASKLVDMEKPKRKRANEEDGKEEGKEEEGKSKVKVESNYVRNKKFAVTKTAEFMTQLPDSSDARRFFTAASTAKKDDLADAFLLGYYFLKKQAPKPRTKRSKKSVAVNVGVE